MKRGRGGYNPYFNRGGGYFQNPKTKPSFTIPGNNSGNNQDQDQIELQQSFNALTFSTEVEQGTYIGWKLYFPGKSFKDSHDLVRRVNAMEHHIKKFIHWYDILKIEQENQFILIVKNLEEDAELFVTWPTLKEDLILKATETLACMGLAMHNVIVSEMSNKQNSSKIENLQHQKIYTRPVGFESATKLSDACHSGGQLITVSGTVIAVDPLQINCKMVCFLCSSCSTELAVQQKPKSLQFAYPASCHPRGCPARGGFVHQLSSPYTILQPKQMIKLRDSNFHEKGPFNQLHVELVQNYVDTVIPGSVVKVTGVLKHCQDKSKKFVKKSESMPLQTYLKCFNVEIISQFESRLQEPTTDKDLTVIKMIRSEPSPFRLLVHSLCPSIYGRVEVKAGLILSLLSGNRLMKKRRSESHVLMIGNPGAGKSKLLQACAEASTKGIYISGPTSTAVGLTASVGHNGSVKAGALMLADGGVCCIDEFDKMLCHTDILLESMEQQEISIMKFGVKINAPSRVVLIAAANPLGSFYDQSKTAIDNVKISIPLMTRFDIIFPLTELDRSSDDAFIQHSRINHNSNSTQSSSFFNTSTTASKAPVSQEKISWLHKFAGEKLDLLPADLFQLYIAHAREQVHPVMSEEAKKLISTFFKSLRNLTFGNEVLPIGFRQQEGLIRLTLSRARADMAEMATRQHAIDVINIIKFSMIDIFTPDDPIDPTQISFSAKKPQSLNVSTMSKPKQIKAFSEQIESQVELVDRTYFTREELKAMAKEIGIKDFEEIVYRLNSEGILLLKPNGYQFCK